jgi:hypothetical protein
MQALCAGEMQYLQALLMAAVWHSLWQVVIKAL